MARPIAFAFALALGALLATGCMRARGTPEDPYVTEVKIQGAEAVDEDTILAKIATQASDRFAWQEARTLDPDALVVDRKRIEALYREHGYYEARVADVKVEKVERGRVKVVFVVEEGRPVRVTKLVVQGLEEPLAVKEIAERLSELPLGEREIFTEGRYDATKGLILSTLRNSGFATAEVTQHANVYPPEHAAEVTYEVKAGRRWKFGTLQPIGTRAVPRERIRRQAELEVTPGEWWDESKLPKAQGRVFGLGVFGGVRMLRGTPDERSGAIPVIIAVREAPFRTIRAGPRAGLEQNVRLDVSGTTGWTNRNFNGDLRRLQLDLRAGYAWILGQSRKEGPVLLTAAEFSQPGAFGPRIDSFARLEVERGLEQAYDFWSERIRVGLPLRLHPRWTLVPSYNIEVYQLSNVAQSFDPSRPSASGPELNNCLHNVCLLSYLEQRVGWDGRDDPIFTRKGLWLQFAIQEGANIGGYGYRYLRLLPEARGYMPLGPDVVLAARARVGALVPLNEAGEPPVVARFEAGGTHSMRGYQTGRLASMVYVDGDWVPVGGNGLVDGSLELRFGISGNLGAALSVDAGNTSPPSALPTAWQEALDPTLLQWAAGVALRYKTVFGPVRLDVGVRVPSNWGPGIRWPNRFAPVPSVENAGDEITLKAGEKCPPGFPVQDGRCLVPGQHIENWLAIHISLGDPF
jgi:translocation and assembly module TamA